MGPLGWLLLVIAALIAVCVIVIRKMSAQQQIAGIGPNDESVTAPSNLYRSQSYYPSSVTSDVLSDMLIGGMASSRSAPNGNGGANGSATTASSPDSASPSAETHAPMTITPLRRIAVRLRTVTAIPPLTVALQIAVRRRIVDHRIPEAPKKLLLAECPIKSPRNFSALENQIEGVYAVFSFWRGIS
jgi:hypothetical protein